MGSWTTAEVQNRNKVRQSICASWEISSSYDEPYLLALLLSATEIELKITSSESRWLVFLFTLVDRGSAVDKHLLRCRVVSLHHGGYLDHFLPVEA
jgi:hypothetical protein